MPDRSGPVDVPTSIRREAPRRPGVYLFQDGAGRTVYVGKSVNLRSRMLSYFRTGLHARTAEMVFSVRGFEFHETHTELLSLLLEDVLIKRNRPIYNMRGENLESYVYLELTNHAYATFRVVKGPDGAGQIYGPFRDQYLAADIVAIVNRHFHLRWCTDPRPFRKSLKYDLGLCPGPCRGRVSMAEYSEIVGRVEAFLGGDPSWISGALEREMGAAAGDMDYERAKALRTDLGFSLRFCTRQRFIRQFKTGTLRIMDEGSPPAEYRFEQGRLTDAGTPEEDLLGSDMLREELTQPLLDGRHAVDRANLLYGWLNRSSDTASYSFN